MDKRARADLFRDRLQQAMLRENRSQSALARTTGVDRSTISQILADTGPRLPNAHLAGLCASALGVSADWLLGLSDRPESAQALLASAMELTDAPRSLVDEQIFSWHREAAGYKIRHVPASLPDIWKTHDMLEWEYTPDLGRTVEQAINASEERLQWMRAAPSDYEIALPRHELICFAQGTGYYSGLNADIRMAQLDHIVELCTQLYPRLRVYIYDARRVYSSPVTIFGPLLAAFYIGRNYVTFRDTERVRAFTEHFDDLVRAADIGDRSSATFIAALRGDVAADQ